MDWSTQVENMMKTWMDTQKKAWDGFYSTMQTMQDMAIPGVTKTPPVRMWETTLTTGQDLFKQFFKTQSEWLATWVESLANMQGVPAQAVESARQFQEMSARWNKTQSELVENWFAAMKKLVPSQPGDAWTEIPGAMFKTWQDTTKNIMDAQMKWLKTWTGAIGKPSDE